MVRSVDPAARYTEPAALNDPDPVNVDELMPNSPKFAVDDPASFETLMFVDAAALLLVF